MNEILLSHGGGGDEMWELIKSVFLKHFSNPTLKKMEDAAIIEVQSRIAFTTDAFTVSPLFFKGGDIGKLSIAGTANDLAVMGARPCYVTVAFIIEEGLKVNELVRIVKSMASEAKKSGIKVVAGDTKVVPRGHADKIFISTSGIGEVVWGGLSASNLKENDVIIVSGSMGDHGSCIMAEREGIGLDVDLESDVTGVWSLVEVALESGVRVHAMRDPTRGGLSSVLNEWAMASGVVIEIEEEKIPLKDAVRGLCEILGLEVFHMASEGRVVFALPENQVDHILESLKNHPEGKGACKIGKVVKGDGGMVILRSSWGSTRVMEPPQGELLPRIC